MGRVTVKIMGKDFLFSCSDEEEEELLAAAKDLDRRMCDVRRSGAATGTERCAIMAALNVCHELLRHKNNPASAGGAQRERVRELTGAVDAALAEHKEPGAY